MNRPPHDNVAWGTVALTEGGLKDFIAGLAELGSSKDPVFCDPGAYLLNDDFKLFQ